MKSPIVVNSQQTYYSVRFGDFERGMQIYQVRQQQLRSNFSSNLDGIRIKFEEMRKKVEASRTHKKDLIQCMKNLKLMKAKFAKANNHKQNLQEKDNKKMKKISTGKVNMLRKDLNIIRIDGEQRLHKLTSKVNALLSEFKGDEGKKKLFKKGKKKGRPTAQKVQKTCLAYLKKAKLLIRDHKSKLNLDFENSLKMQRSEILIKLANLLEIVRKERRNHHYKLHQFVHNTDTKVVNMLKEKKVQLQF